MKKIITIIIFIFTNFMILAQNTADLFIENPTINEGKFSFEIHITPTNDWGSNAGDKSLGYCSWYFNYNSSALANPIITFIGTVVDASHYDNTTDISGGQLYIDTHIHNFDPGVPLTQGTKYHVYTVELEITNSSQESDLTWDESNTGIFSATDNLTNENYNGDGNNPLPVELSSFSAKSKGNNIKLLWQTATEVNNYGFEVERKVNISETGSWKKVGFVAGNGNSNSPKSYSFIDNNLVGGSKFSYRLKQIDIDGKSDYSKEVTIEVLPTSYGLEQNYPNPFNPETNINFSLLEDSQVVINIYNILGEKVMELINKYYKAGFQQVRFNTTSAGLPSGIYIYTLDTKNFKAVKKMILMK